MAPQAAIRNTEGWEEYLLHHQAPGIKNIVVDLAKLKQLLGADTLDGTKIKALVLKLGKETAAVAKEGGSNATHIGELGSTLQGTA